MNQYFATVEEVTSNGIKLRLDGEQEARETYYNSISQVNKDDRVYINYVSGTILILGKLLYKERS
ncbi:hypothetical protein PBV87_11470 [Niameybacter massiliensis]|uniref:Uncharacterized protein n=1 Tax=Holtiella tumoricola TaxID=3018743 RepID=A0AA42DNI9_9FIRM|nr:hypothetical protein [Holtiella tumoricola]MDA3732102.1 hypothetical protein [Holtiella tumoricola]